MAVKRTDNRVKERVIRRVESPDRSGKPQVRLDVGGPWKNPRLCVFIGPNHPLAATKVGERMSDHWQGTLLCIRRVHLIRRDGEKEIRLDLGGTLAKPEVVIYSVPRYHLAKTHEGDIVSL